MSVEEQVGLGLVCLSWVLGFSTLVLHQLLARRKKKKGKKHRRSRR